MLAGTTAKISEYPNHEIECSLSDILEDNVPEKYYLSRKQAEKLLYKEKPTQGERIYSWVYSFVEYITPRKNTAKH